MGFLTCNGVKTLNCVDEPSSVLESNADIAGRGVVYSFIIAAWLSIFLTIVITISDWKTWHRARRFFGDILLGLSDGQIITGAAISLAGLFQRCNISVYHYVLIGDMTFLSMTTYILTLTVLAGRHGKRFLTTALRVGLFLFVLVLYTIVQLPASSMERRNDGIKWPAGCYWTGSFFARNNNNVPTVSESAKVARGILLIVTAAGASALAIMSLWLGPRRWIDTRLGNWGYIIRALVFQFGLPLAIAIYGTTMLSRDWGFVTFSENQNANQTSTRLTLADDEQSKWGFGQIVPVVMLAALVLPMAEFFRANPYDEENYLDVQLHGKPNALLREEPLSKEVQEVWDSQA